MLPEGNCINSPSEEDVSQTLYKDTLQKKAEEAATASLPVKGSKVNRICDAFLATLEKRLDTNLHNLITAHVCKSPPALEAGLQLVARLRGKSRMDGKLSGADTHEFIRASP